MRTYATFTHSFGTETYVSISGSRRSYLDHIKLGVMSLEIENTPICDKYTELNRKRYPSERLCTLWNMDLCEDEIHILIICPLYVEERNFRILVRILVRIATAIFPIYLTLKKMIYLIPYCQHELMSYIPKAWNIRTSKLKSQLLTDRVY